MNDLVIAVKMVHSIPSRLMPADLVVAGHGGGVLVQPGLDALVEFGRAALLIEGGDIQLYVRAGSSFQNHVAVQRIGAKNGDLQTHGSGQLHDLSGVRDGHGAEDDFRAGGDGLRQVGAEVGGVGGEGVGDDLAVKGIGKVLNQALIVLVAQLAQAIGLLGGELLLREVGQNGALEGVQEADAEIVVIARSDAGVGAGHADGGQTRFTEDGAAGHGAAGAVSTQHQRNVLAHQLRSGGRSLGGIGAVSLFVAAIGIANTMMMSIYERTKEIGVMKVIGCSLGNIRQMFLLEAAFIGLGGGVIGNVLSFLMSAAINALVKGKEMGMTTGQISYIPLWLVLVSLGFAMLVGTAAGYFPARRAMKLSPLAAIRNE